MKNFEKYEKEIMGIFNDGNCFSVSKKGEIVKCCLDNCKQCIFDDGCNQIIFTKWLYEEYVEKPVLNKYERAFCEAVGTGWIVRWADGCLSLSKTKPVKYTVHKYWLNTDEYVTPKIPYHINPELKFGFIRWEDKEPWSIEELLKLEYEK